MKISVKINHIAILVKNLDKARQFYGTILKLEEIKRPDFFINGAWYKLGDSELHLMLCEDFPFPHVHSLSETVQPHFALSMHTTDFNEITKYLIKSGIQFIEMEKSLDGITQAFFYDYDRNMIEINDAQQ